MGIFSWFSGNKKGANSKPTPPKPDSRADPKIQQSSPSEVPGMNGAMKVPRPDPAAIISVFEFGSVDTSADKVTLAGYCPVSEELEPCLWEILPATHPDAPQFRVVF